MLFCLLIGTLQVQGINIRKKINKNYEKELKLAPIEDHYLPFNDPKFYSDIIKKNKLNKRNPAASDEKNKTDVDYKDQEFSDEFVKLRLELIGDGEHKKGVQTAEALQKIISNYSKKETYESLKDPSTKLAVLQLRALAPFRGFIFRARKYTGNVSITRTLIVTMLNAQISGIKMLFPLTGNNNNQWEVVFKYITEPTENLQYEITNDSQLHSAYSDLAHALSSVHSDFGNLIATLPRDIWWDNKMFMSFANMSNRRDRFVKLGYVELSAMYSAFSLGLSSLYSTVAYSFDGLRDLLKSYGQFFGVGVGAIETTLDGDVLHKQGIFTAIKKRLENGIVDIDSFLKQGNDGLTSFARTGILNSYPNLFRRIDSPTPTKNGTSGVYGIIAMRKAYQLLVESTRSAYSAFRKSENSNNINNSEDSLLFDSRVAQAFSRTMGGSLENLQMLIAGMSETQDTQVNITCDNRGAQTIGSAVVNGEVLRMNIAQFYCNPPSHLNELYAQDWDTSAKLREVQAWGRNETLRNYKYGMATHWGTKAYKNIFPDITTTNTIKRNGKDINVTDQVSKYNQILLQTWGGVAFALPISSVIF